MMKAQHTPGPWKATGNPYSDKARDVIAPNGDRIAALNGAAFDYSSEVAANARLIASAPELLAALENMVSHFPFWASKMQMTRIDRDAVALARHAIAKAKGMDQ